MRAFLAEVAEISRRAFAPRTADDLQPIDSLYTARSFSSPEEMGHSTRSIRQLLHVNGRAAARLEHALSRMKGRIEKARWEKPAARQFWAEVDRLFTESLQARFQLLELQRKWTQATIDLYEYVLTHSEQLAFEGRLVRSRDPEVGRDFLQKLHLAKQYRDTFRRESAEMNDTSAALLEKWGSGKPRP